MEVFGRKGQESGIATMEAVNKTRFVLNLLTALIWTANLYATPHFIPVTYWLNIVLIMLYLAYPIGTLITVSYDYIHFQITLHKERIQNRRRYELFKSGVKDGLFTTDEQVERENRRIIK